MLVEEWSVGIEGGAALAFLLSRLVYEDADGLWQIGFTSASFPPAHSTLHYYW